eukprot:5427194-Amphidinium_carterae.2
MTTPKVSRKAASATSSDTPQAAILMSTTKQPRNRADLSIKTAVQSAIRDNLKGMTQYQLDQKIVQGALGLKE